LFQLIAAVTEFVKHELGQKFIESPAADLTEIFKDLNKTTALIFVLSQGSGKCFKSVYLLNRHFIY
jgi:hypothetical protein